MIRILSALLLAVLLNAGCDKGDMLMPPEAAEVNGGNLPDSVSSLENLIITADEARQKPGMVENVYPKIFDDLPYSMWSPSDYRFAPGEVGYVVFRFPNLPPTSRHFVTHLKVLFCSLEVQIVSEEPSRLAENLQEFLAHQETQTVFETFPESLQELSAEGCKRWDYDRETTFALDANYEVVIPFIFRSSSQSVERPFAFVFIEFVMPQYPGSIGVSTGIFGVE